jgi:hypothetical protein
VTALPEVKNSDLVILEEVDVDAVDAHLADAEGCQGAGAVEDVDARRLSRTTPLMVPPQPTVLEESVLGEGFKFALLACLGSPLKFFTQVLHLLLYDKWAAYWVVSYRLRDHDRTRWAVFSRALDPAFGLRTCAHAPLPA